jgi:hypothetical protein
VARATLSPAQTRHLTAKFAHDGLRVGLLLPLVLRLVRHDAAGASSHAQDAPHTAKFARDVLRLGPPMLPGTPLFCGEKPVISQPPRTVVGAAGTPAGPQPTAPHPMQAFLCISLAGECSAVAALLWRLCCGSSSGGLLTTARVTLTRRREPAA